MGGVNNKDIAPALRFALKEYRLYINLALLEKLKNPLYLQFLFENERKLLAVSGSIEKLKHSFEIPKRTYRDGDDECYISRMPLTEAFRFRMDWNGRENYRVKGEYAEHLEVVLFDLTQAVIIGSEEG
jgi:hypothetical protein